MYAAQPCVPHGSPPNRGSCQMPVNVAGALRNEARPGRPLISRGTYELVRDRFAYDPGGPRTVNVIVIYANTVFKATVAQDYTVKKTTGKTKMPK